MILSRAEILGGLLCLAAILILVWEAML